MCVDVWKWCVVAVMVCGYKKYICITYARTRPHHMYQYHMSEMYHVSPQEFGELVCLSHCWSDLARRKLELERQRSEKLEKWELECERLEKQEAFQAIVCDRLERLERVERLGRLERVEWHRLERQRLRRARLARR